MDITTLFDEDSPDLEPYLEKNKVGASWGGATKTWTVAEVTIDKEHTINPFNGKVQTKVVLSLDDGSVPEPPVPRPGMPT